MTINVNLDYDLSSTRANNHINKTSPKRNRSYESTDKYRLKEDDHTINNPKIINPYKKNKIGKLIIGNHRKKK